MNTGNGWLGELWLGEDHAVLVGNPGRTDSHAHYAHQVLIALDGELQLKIDGQIESGVLLVIPSLQAHEVPGDLGRCITLFGEPLAFELGTLVALCEQAQGDVPRLLELLQQAPRRALDPRLAKALQCIRTLDEQPLSATTLAQAAALSLSQLERLFSGSLGLSVRRLVLWQRLRLALHSAVGGASLTTAALAAGFSDSAHLSRSMRQQFGVRPSEALRQLRSAVDV